MERTHQVFKFAFIPFAIALIASTLVGWGVSLIAKPSVELYAGIAGGVSAAVFLLTSAMARGSRSSVVIKTVSGAFLTGGIVLSIVFALAVTDIKWYAISFGLLLVAFASIIYNVAQSGQ